MWGAMNEQGATAQVNSLVIEIAKGDRSALEALFRMEAGRLLAVARRIVRRSDLAEEVVQDAFVAIWQRSGQYDPRYGEARGWITRIVRNRALNLLRDAGRVDHVDSKTLEAMGDRTGDASNAYELLPERHALKGCLRQLDARKRTAILLCYVTGLTHGEVAAKLDAPLGTVKAWIRLGMTALQECLG
ncbi:MAG: RNA polymerase subunit sigma [Rhizobiales bacterium]|nr:RNA polymerase subunit sigma [Hyphomicrobiales bacterium]